MKQRPRIYYWASQRALIWDRGRKGGLFTTLRVCLIDTIIDPRHFG
jgi:hypothetical protein